MLGLADEVEGGQGAGVWRRGSKQRGEWVVDVVDFGDCEVEGVELDVVVEVEVEAKGCEWLVGPDGDDVEDEEVATTVVLGAPKILDGKLNTYIVSTSHPVRSVLSDTVSGNWRDRPLLPLDSEMILTLTVSTSVVVPRW